MLAVLMLFTAFARAQTPQTPQTPAPRNGVIAGQVVDAATGKPVGAVIVGISGPGITMRVNPPEGRGSLGVSVNPSVPRVLTGADGRFMFRDLQTGNFTITASKNGYSEGASGRRRPGGTPLPVVIANAQPSATTSVRVWKNGAIGGTVFDEAGDPVVGLQLRALMRTTAGGRRRFMPAGGGAVTDDRGIYRFSDLVPGEYMVIAAPPPVGSQSAREEALICAVSGGGGSGGRRWV